MMLASLVVAAGAALAGNVAPPPSLAQLAAPRFVFISDELECAGERIALDIERAQGGIPASSSCWADATVRLAQAQRRGAVDAVDAVILSLTRPQLGLERGAFMKLMHAQLDAIRAAAPRSWILLVAPDVTTSTAVDGVLHVESAGLWLNAVSHKRGDGQLKWITLPLPALSSSPAQAQANVATREQCVAHAGEIAEELRERFAAAKASPTR